MPAEPSPQCVMGLKDWVMLGFILPHSDGVIAGMLASGEAAAAVGVSLAVKQTEVLLRFYAHLALVIWTLSLGKERAIAASPEEQLGCRAAPGTAPPLDGTRCPPSSLRGNKLFPVFFRK